jgi:hypothetical protein
VHHHDAEAGAPFPISKKKVALFKKSMKRHSKASIQKKKSHMLIMICSKQLVFLAA